MPMLAIVAGNETVCLRKGGSIVPRFKQGSTILLQGEDFGAISKEFGPVRCNLGGDNVEICDLSTADIMDDLFQAVGESFVVLLGQAFRSSSQTHQDFVICEVRDPVSAWGWDSTQTTRATTKECGRVRNLCRPSSFNERTVHTNAPKMLTLARIIIANTA